MRKLNTLEYMTADMGLNINFLIQYSDRGRDGGKATVSLKGQDKTVLRFREYDIIALHTSKETFF